MQAPTITDEGAPIEQPKDPDRLTREIQAKQARDQAEQFNQIANHQKQMCARVGAANPWLADRYMRASKANRSLAVAIATVAGRIAA